MRNRKMMFGRYRANLKWIAVAFVLVLALGPMAVAQSSKVLTLEEAVDFPPKNYPAGRASLERVNAAQAGVGLAPTTPLPPAPMPWQTDRKTTHKIPGLPLPPTPVGSP